MDSCPCGSELPYGECCEPVIKGEKPAETAEQLMRSRYSAYVKKEIDYLATSLHPDHRKDFDPKNTRDWAESAEWHKLEIISTKDGGPDDLEGEVEFIATSEERQVKHQAAGFTKEEKGIFWTARPQPRNSMRSTPKTGRNDPCSCRQEKYKCCGNRWF
jgi:SEC-C motif-containing protein